MEASNIIVGVYRSNWSNVACGCVKMWGEKTKPKTRPPGDKTRPTGTLLIYSSTHRLIDSSTHRLIDSSTHRLTYSPTDLLIYWSTHLLIYSSTHLLSSPLLSSPLLSSPLLSSPLANVGFGNFNVGFGNSQALGFGNSPPPGFGNFNVGFGNLQALGFGNLLLPGFGNFEARGFGNSPPPWFGNFNVEFGNFQALGFGNLPPPRIWKLQRRIRKLGRALIWKIPVPWFQKQTNLLTALWINRITPDVVLRTDLLCIRIDAIRTVDHPRSQYILI